MKIELDIENFQGLSNLGITQGGSRCCLWEFKMESNSELRSDHSNFSNITNKTNLEINLPNYSFSVKIK